MSFLERFLKKEPKQVEFKALSFDPNSFLAYALTGKVINSMNAFEFYKESSAVATAVDTIADEVEQIQPVIRGPDGKFIDKHPILELLKKPNPMESYRSFIGSLARHWLLTHENFIYFQGLETKLPINIWSVKPLTVSKTESSLDGYPSTLQVGSGPGTDVYPRKEDLKNRTWNFKADQLKELVWIHGFSSDTASTMPDSPLQAASSDVSQQIKGKIHNVRMIENGGRLSMVAIFKDTLDPEQHDDRTARIQSQLAGASNAGKIAVISSQDMELKEMGASNKDMDYVNLDKISATAIYLRYKIPLPLISADASTYNNMEQAKFDLYDRAVLPCINVIFEGLTNSLMPRMGLNPADFQITYNPEAIPALRGRMLEELKVRKELNLETINELRSMLPGREPLSEGGDAVYQNASLVPVGVDLYTEDNASELDAAAKARLKNEQ